MGFAFIPASDRSRAAIGTLVPHEGGPGYSTTGSAEWYTDIYRPLMDRRNVLLVDQRGTGRSEAITCDPALCPKVLGKRAYSYGTEASADDLAAVLDALSISKVDMYGDSYGTFFGQVFAGRHPERLRTLVLDGAYPTYGESAWYPTQGPALKSANSIVCARGPLCAQETSRPDADLRRLVARLRRDPIRVNAPAFDGRRHTFTLYASDVVLVAYRATYGTDIYQQFTASVRAALNGDHVPLGRLVANEWWGSDNVSSSASEFSEGLDYAVSCHDYPQVFSLYASKSVRRQQYAEAVRRMQRTNPGIYAPFTIREYLDSGWSSMDMCIDWPRPTVAVGPPRPVGGSYPAVPTMVLSGELDTITTPAEGEMVHQRFPRSAHIVVRNASHVTAAFRYSCGSVILRHVITTGDIAIPSRMRRCAEPEIRTVGRYARFADDVELPVGVTDSPRARLAAGVLATWGDVVQQWWVSPSNSGIGLRGGSWSATRGAQWRIALRDVRLSSDLPVTGRITVDFQTGVAHATAVLPGRSDIASVTARWNLWTDHAKTTVRITRTSGAVSSVTLFAP